MLASPACNYSQPKTYRSPAPHKAVESSERGGLSFFSVSGSIRAAVFKAQPCFFPVLSTTKRTLPKLLHLPPRHEEKAQRSPEKERSPRGVQAEIAEVRRTCPSKSKMNCPRRMLPAIPETLGCPTPLLLPESSWQGRSGRDGIGFDEPETSVFRLSLDEPSLPVFRQCPAMPQAGTHEEG